MRLCVLLSKPEIIKQMEMEKEKLNSKFIFKLDKEYDNSLEITNIKYKKDVLY